jgi:hypothetical protein
MARRGAARRRRRRSHGGSALDRRARWSPTRRHSLARSDDFTSHAHSAFDLERNRRRANALTGLDPFQPRRERARNVGAGARRQTRSGAQPHFPHLVERSDVAIGRGGRSRARALPLLDVAMARSIAGINAYIPTLITPPGERRAPQGCSRRRRRRGDLGDHLSCTPVDSPLRREDRPAHGDRFVEPVAATCGFPNPRAPADRTGGPAIGSLGEGQASPTARPIRRPSPT